jgi:aryl-phospho-beta-D-glucosidase BglC (GH1 family)
MIGVNLSGAEFGSGSRYGYDYTYPNSGELDYYKSQGMTLIRLPFKWERIQTSVGGELNTAELGRMKAFLDQAAARGMQVVLDLHNYGVYGDQRLGSAGLPPQALVDVWTKLAAQLRDHPGVYGYGLMNEPAHVTGDWRAIAQAVVDGIRATGDTTNVIVSGRGWDGAWTWKQFNADFVINDPTGNLLYEAHQYFDRSGSGIYGSYDHEGAYANIGVDRLQPFIEWLEQHDAKGFIGEFGVPGNDPRWMAVLENFARAMQQHGIPGTYWAGGPWWGDYALSIEPGNGGHKPQLEALRPYLDDAAGDLDGPGDLTGTPLSADPTDVWATQVVYKTVSDITSPEDGVLMYREVASDDAIKLPREIAHQAWHWSPDGSLADGTSGRDLAYLEEGSSIRAVNGGAGDDVYIVRYVPGRLTDGDPRIVEAAGEGDDTVWVSQSDYILANNVENLVSMTERGVRMLANDGGNKFIGGPGDDQLFSDRRRRDRRAVRQCRQ